MKRACGLAVLFCLFSSLLASSQQNPQRIPSNPWSSRTNSTPSQAGKPALRDYVPGQLLVRFRPEISRQMSQAAHDAVGVSLMREFRSVKNLQLVKVPDKTSLKQMLTYYRSRPDVIYAEPNYIRRAEQSPLQPNDPNFPEMWNLHNTGQTGGKPSADIRAPEAWGLSTGDWKVVVVVIDTGVDYTHPDLHANMYQNSADCNSNHVDDDGNGYVDDCYGIDAVNGDSDPMDDYGHGTHVAGTIGAAGNNGLGVVGINWQVQIMACKFLDSGGYGDVAGFLKCMDYVAKMKDRGVNIVATNNSYGGSGSSQSEYDAIDAHRQRGILFIAASGNLRANADFIRSYPAQYDLPNIISVAASNDKDERSEFSNYGRHSVHLAAPGENILSTVPPALYGDAYLYASGTSMAAPHVTGVAALLKAQDSTRDWIHIKNLLLAGGDVVSAGAQTIAQRRLNAYGAMTCSNTVVQQRLQPMQDDAYVWVNDTLRMRYLNIRCGSVNGQLEAGVDGGAERIVFADDGVAPDQQAGDGVYVAQRTWTTTEVGDHTLTFPNNEVLRVHVIESLQPYALTTDVAFDYREITGTDLRLGDDDSATVQPPFPLHFGGTDFTAVSVNSNGNLTFFGPFVDWENTALPAANAPTLVAPFWDDLSGYVHWATVGTSPNREFVVEWQSGAMACIWSDYPSYDAKFQVVFFEDSSDVLFNYEQVMLGREHIPNDESWGCIGPQNAGANATVGLQSTTTFANQFSFDTPSLSDNSSILWRLGPMAASIDELTPVNATAGGGTFALHVLGESFLPSSVVRWNGSGLATTFVSAGELSAVVPTASVAHAGKAQITVFNAGPNGAGDSPAVEFPIYDSNPVPTLTSVDPDTISIVRETLPLIVTGTGFSKGSVARWNGTAHVTTVLSSTKLRLAVEMNDYRTTGPAQVTVFNPSPGGGASNALPVAVVNPEPKLLFIFPEHIGAGNSDFTLQVTGSGFGPASVVRWNGIDRPTSMPRMVHQYVTGQIPAADVAAVGTAEISVFTPTPGGGTSNKLDLPILAPPANDRIENAAVIPSFPYSVSEDTAGATYGNNEPQPPCIGYPPQGQNVWFVFTPPAAGAGVYVQASAHEVVYYQYQYVVSAWTGTPGQLRNIGCNIELSEAPTKLGVLAPSTAPIYFMVSAMLGASKDLTFSLDVGPGFTMGVSPATATVARGRNATYTISITPQYGAYNTPVQFTCYPSDYRSTCSISPRSVVPGAAVTTATMTVGTANVTPSTITVPRAAPVAPVHRKTRLKPWLVLAFGIAILAGGTRIRNRPKFLVLILAAAAICLFGIQTGCGGSSNSSPPPPHPPSISSISPTSVAAGSSAFTLTVLGANFASDSVVRWNRTDKTTTFISGGELHASIAPSDVASTGGFSVSVYNPSTGGGVSNSQTFSVVPSQAETKYTITVIASSSNGMSQVGTVEVKVTQ